MTAMFPFGLPLPTAFYLVLYVATLVIHVLFMNYVLAGTAYLAWSALRGRGAAATYQRQPLALVLRDWMPFAVSAAITAGVAPLLFLQILYKENFYTANLLGFHRWMSILPVLIVGFYLVYLLKSRSAGRWPVGARVAVGAGAFFCFAFTGYSWTENHLLSVDESAWAEVYASGSLVYANARLLPRLGLWAVGALPALALLASWQMWYLKRRGARPGTHVLPPADLAAQAEPDWTGQARLLAGLALAGLLGAAACGAAYYAVMGPAERATFLGPFAGPWFLVALAGTAVQAAGWVSQWRKRHLCHYRLALISAGWLLTALGMTVVREGLRLAALDITRFYPQHQEAAAIGGLSVFLLFFTLNALLIAWCFRLVARGRVAAATG